jgi:hypothetical protein
MNDSRRTIQERYIAATQSGNLQDSAERTAADFLKAYAMVGGLGSMLVRVKSGLDTKSFPQLLDAWQDHVRQMADRKHWPVCVKPSKVAAEVLRYWLDNICRQCTGVVTRAICSACDGCGITPPQFAPEYRRYALDALAELEEIDRLTGVSALKLLKNNK